MTFRTSVGRYSALLLAGLLGACQSAAHSGFESYADLHSHPSTIAYGKTTLAQATPEEPPIHTTILNQAIASQPELGVCDDNLNVEQSKVGSQLYATGENQYLVQLLCFQAAYQGNYAFVVADLQSGQINLTPLPLALAGYPQYDSNTQILSNTYKFRGIGDCLEHSEYRWTGGEFALLTSQLEDVVPQGCELFKGGETHRISATQVGPAKLGMLLSELKQAMGDRASFKPVPLGVDMGIGLQVSNYGEVQFEIGSDTGAPLQDDTKISFIRVRNPVYKTVEGVGPGTPLKQAIQSYGPATLSLNVENESREFIRFAKGVPPNILMRSNQWALDGEAGVYADAASSYRTTTEFKPKAAVGAVTITASS